MSFQPSKQHPADVGTGADRCRSVAPPECQLYIAERLGKQISAVPDIPVTPFHGLAGEFYQLAFGRPKATDENIHTLLAKAAKATDLTGFTIRFLVSEWTQVIDAWQLDNEAA